MSVRVAIVMGSASDRATMSVAEETFGGLGLEPRGVKVVIAAAGAAAMAAKILAS